MKRIGITECKTIKSRDVNNNRYIDCADYDDCLMEAVKKNMHSFHCNNCHAFQEFKKAIKNDDRYEVGGKFIQRFRPGFMDIDSKNIGTLWND